MTTIDQVKAFHIKFNVGDYIRREQAVRFLLSELAELADAETDFARLDALCDLQYVLDGAFLAYGWASIKDAAFAEVHKSNMSKSLGPKGVGGKVQKGVDFVPPNLEQFLPK